LAAGFWNHEIVPAYEPWATWMTIRSILSLVGRLDTAYPAELAATQRALG
jgi:hypothetical protein